MELVWICLVALTYLGLIGAFLMYRKIKNLEDCIDRDLRLYNTRINKHDDQLYELKQKVDKVPKVETKPIPCTEWTPTSERYPSPDVNKRFQHVWKAYDDIWERIDEIEDELKEFKNDCGQNENAIDLIGMKVDGACKRLDRLEQQVNVLKKEPSDASE